ncbi:MAG: hypothetical protein CMJ47_02820 [Planctomyces sp.]|nr:hypothetical protein [Planctomyces sp.]
MKRKPATRPENLDDDETQIRPDEDFRIWCRQDGQQVIIRQRKVYVEQQVCWIFEVSENALATLRKQGLPAPRIGTIHFPGAQLIRFIDAQAEVLTETGEAH